MKINRLTRDVRSEYALQSGRTSRVWCGSLSTCTGTAVRYAAIKKTQTHTKTLAHIQITITSKQHALISP